MLKKISIVVFALVCAASEACGPVATSSTVSSRSGPPPSAAPVSPIDAGSPTGGTAAIMGLDIHQAARFVSRLQWRETANVIVVSSSDAALDLNLRASDPAVAFATLARAAGLEAVELSVGYLIAPSEIASEVRDAKPAAMVRGEKVDLDLMRASLRTLLDLLGQIDGREVRADIDGEITLRLREVDHLALLETLARIAGADLSIDGGGIALGAPGRELPPVRPSTDGPTVVQDPMRDQRTYFPQTPVARLSLGGLGFFRDGYRAAVVRSPQGGGPSALHVIDDERDYDLLGVEKLRVQEMDESGVVLEGGVRLATLRETGLRCWTADDLPEIEQVLRSSSGAEWFEHLDALSRLGDDAARAVPVLVDLLKSDPPLDDDRLYEVLHLIDDLGPAAREAAPALVEMLGRNEPREWQVLGCLAKIGEPLPPAGREALVRILMDPDRDDDVRHEAMNALSHLGEEAIPIFIEVIQLEGPVEGDAMNDIRSLAGIALNELGPAGDSAALDLMLTPGTSPEVRERFTFTIYPESEVNDEIVERLIDAVSNTDPAVRLFAVENLAHMEFSVDRVFCALRKAAKDRDRKVRDAARSAVEEMRPDAQGLECR